jgi:hypothetical protein
VNTVIERPRAEERGRAPLASTADPDAADPRRFTASSTRAALLEPTTTCAPSRIASVATAKPMPELPPMMTTR